MAEQNTNDSSKRTAKLVNKQPVNIVSFRVMYDKLSPLSEQETPSRGIEEIFGKSRKYNLVEPLYK